MNNERIVMACHALRKIYQQHNEILEVLSYVDFSVTQGSSVAIVGSSGSGKSTLLHVLAGLDLPSSGKVIVGNNDFAQLSDKQRSAARNTNLGFVFQFHHLLQDFNAIENVALPLLIRGESPIFAKNEAIAMLEKVGLQHRTEHFPSELSGGERQRVAIARAMVIRPLVLLADEPTGNLDQDTAQSVFDMMRELQNLDKIALVVATHDLVLAKQLDHCYHLTHGKLHTQP